MNEIFNNGTHKIESSGVSVGVLPDPIRTITKRAFWTRVTDVKYAELIDLSKTDSLLEARLSIINGAEFVDLDNEDLNNAFDDLVSAGIFNLEDKVIIFADGKDSEKPS